MGEVTCSTLIPISPMSTLAVGISTILSSTSPAPGVTPDMLIAKFSFGV